MQFAVGERVDVEIQNSSFSTGSEHDPKTQTVTGNVKFFGKCEFNPEGSWVGVVLDEAKGKNNGTVQGVSYFSCEDKHGLFIRPEYVRVHKEANNLSGDTYMDIGNEHKLSVNGTEKQKKRIDINLNHDSASLLIQTRYRKHLAKKEVDKLMAVRTWNILDNHNEEEVLRKGKKFGKVSKQLQAETLYHDDDDEEYFEDNENESMDSDENTKTIEDLQREAAQVVARMTDEDLDRLRVDSKYYSGPHLKFPLTLSNVKEMLEAFTNDQVLHYKYFMQLLLKARKIFNEEETLQEITIPEAEPGKTPIRLTVVGDTHGQLQDLFTIFNINGSPSEHNWYLFNGDFVDRGKKGCEIIATLIAFKILFPNSVFLNRGNHEARAQNAWMGYEEELLNKYGKNKSTVRMLDADKHSSLKLYTLNMALFDSLPLCALIQKRVFVCHGGLFRNKVSLNHLRKINRKREPPLEGYSMEDKIYEDLLWSDPRPTSTYPRPLEERRASDRGAGCEFGYKVTDQFCAHNQVALVVRSHECVPEGFEVLHNGRLITIFSASRYCGTQTNKGAFMSFGYDLQPEIEQFYALANNTFLSDEERQAKLVSDTILRIFEYVSDKRLDLYWYFTQNDVEHSGTISRVDWASGLTSVLGLSLPYLYFQNDLAEVDELGLINYSKFLSRPQIHMGDRDSSWQDAIVKRVCQKLYALVGDDMEKAYRQFDTNDDGIIQFHEFIEMIKKLDSSITDEQIYDLMRSMDVNDDAHIDYNEFAEKFKLDQANVETTLTHKIVEKVSNLLYQNRIQIEHAFRSLDVEGKGFVTKDGFLMRMKRISSVFETPLTSVEIEELANALDTNSDGRIDYKEFFQGMSITY